MKEKKKDNSSLAFQTIFPYRNPQLVKKGEQNYSTPKNSIARRNLTGTLRQTKSWLKDNYEQITNTSQYVLLGLEISSIGLGLTQRSYAYEFYTSTVAFGAALLYSSIPPKKGLERKMKESTRKEVLRRFINNRR